MNLDGMIVKKAVTQSCLSVLLDLGVTPQMLLGDGRDGLKYAYEFYQQYGKVPEWATVIDKVPALASLNGEAVMREPIEFFVDQVLERYRKKVLYDGAQELAQKIEKGTSAEALDVLSLTSKRVTNLTREEESAVQVTDPKEIKWARETYEKLEAGKGAPDGLPTPWECLTNHTMGVHNGELWFVAARLKTGK